jgi:hypothetical protein
MLMTVLYDWKHSSENSKWSEIFATPNSRSNLQTMTMNCLDQVEGRKEVIRYDTVRYERESIELLLQFQLWYYPIKRMFLRVTTFVSVDSRVLPLLSYYAMRRETRQKGGRMTGLGGTYNQYGVLRYRVNRRPNSRRRGSFPQRSQLTKRPARINITNI